MNIEVQPHKFEDTFVIAQVFPTHRVFLNTRGTFDSNGTTKQWKTEARAKQALTDLLAAIAERNAR